MKAARLTIIGVVLLAFILGCATFTRNAYRTLAVSQQTYDATLSALGDMYKQGMLSDEHKDKAVELGTLYKAAHNSAVQALLQYESNPTPDNKQRYLESAAFASQQLAMLLEFAKPFLVKGVK